MPTPTQTVYGQHIIATRKHPIYEKRIKQLDLNRLAVRGGRDYINERLWRAPNETDTQWFGDAAEQIVGRRERSCLVNDAQRIAGKIRQYIFKVAPQREGIDPIFSAGCGGDNVGVDEFMGQVCDALTTGQWCWIQVDSEPAKYDQEGNPLAQTLANKPKVFWRLWTSKDIPDWCIETDGTVRWVIVRTHVYVNSNPLVEPKDFEISTLFVLNPVDGKVYKTEKCNDSNCPFPLADNEVIEGLDRIPFILVGKPSSDCWWFDDVENIQAQVMNYDSMHNETLTDAVYPQLVVPMALLNTLETKLDIEKLSGQKLITLQRELIKGRKNPFYENAEEKGVTRYIQPSSGDLKMITEEQDRKRKLLFDMCGLALFNRETRQVQTAESKSFDQLDTNATLGNRAQILQKAEAAAVALSKYFDTTFAVYEPAYNTKFDVVDVVALSQCIQEIAQMPNATPKMRRLCLKNAVRIILECGGVGEEDYAEIVAEIEAIPDEELMSAANPFADLVEGQDKPDEDDPDKGKGEEGDDPDKKKPPKTTEGQD